MGMFDKDKEFGNRLDLEFQENEHFIVWDAEIADHKIDTTFGEADVAKLVVSRMDDTDNQIECTTVASAIVDKVRAQEDGDLPAVVKLMRVKGRGKKQALVMQFVREYSA